MNQRVLLTWIFVLAASTVFGQVTADYDKSVDFSKYKTYTFAGWQKGSDQILNDLDKKRLQEAFKEEFSARGMEYVESGGDAIVTLFITTQDKQNTTAYTNFTGGMGLAGGWGWAGGWGGMGSATTSYSTSDYTEGTLVADVYDAASKSMLWQGSLISVLKSASKRDKNIPKGVAKLMKKYPVEPMK